MNLARTAGCFVLAAMACAPARASNAEPGNCDALKMHIQSPGVEDDDGNPHAGHAGWTLPRFGIAANYTNQTSRTRKGRICWTATAHPQFTTNPAMSWLDWRPTGCNQCACDFDRDGWIEGIKGHEQHHADDDRDLVKSANAKLSGKRPFTVPVAICIPISSPQNPTPAWDSEVAQAMAPMLGALERRAVRTAARYDKSAIGDDPVCDNCKACRASEVAQCDPCSRCNSATGVCEAKDLPSCVPPPTCCCWKYVLGQQGCQVGTIEESACDAMNVPNLVTARCSFPCSDAMGVCN